MPATTLEPGLAEARALHRAGDLDAAEAAYRSVLDRQPADPAASSSLGELLLAKGQTAEAIRHLQVPAALHNPTAQALSNLGFAHLRNGSHEFGLEPLRTAAALEPDNWRIRSNLGQIYLKMDNHREALAQFESAHRLNPEAMEVRLHLAGAVAGLGDFARARALIEPCLNDPRYATGAIGMLVREGKQTAERNELPRIMRALATATEPMALRNLHFAAAKTHLDLGDADQAFAHFRMARAQPDRHFKRDTFARGLQQARTLAGMSRDTTGEPEAAPIFIVGMPRCGSSLTEQILSGHAGLHGAGERQYIPTIAKRLGFGSADPDGYAEAIRRLPPDALPQIAAGYRSLMQTAGAGQGGRTIDKFLHNFMQIGLINLLFPNAQIIHCRRQPLDCCLSIYTSPLIQGHEYADDLATLGWYYRQYEAQMAFWEAQYPDAILNVDYEATVADIEGSARRITAFLGLDWDPAVLDFVANERGVSTASRWQVRQPLYSSSVNRWQKYREHLQPLIQALGET
ncbi:MAG: sulfotransferase [Devosia sp.]